MKELISFVKQNNSTSMKTIVQLIFAIVLTTGLTAQEETLVGNINHIGGFGGPFIEVSTVNGETVADVGGGGALIIDNLFFGGYGLGTDAASINGDNELYDISLGHGGLWFGYVMNQHKLVHIYTSFKLGWGGVDLKNGAGEKAFTDNMLVISPEAGIELNVTSWFKVGLTGGYRFVDGLNDLPFELQDEDFSSPFGKITFRFGGFADFDWDDDDDDDIDFEF